MIDIVYTWVDGSDADWLKKKEHYYHNDPMYKNIIDDQVSLHRYSDHNELKLSIISIKKYAPWVNHIYIVTDNQQPTWLSEFDGISIVDHKDIIPNEFLPTFNSSVIESYLHKIPNLQEKFIYFNDDTLLGKKAYPSDFFKGDKPYLFTSSMLPKYKSLKEDATYNIKCIYNSRDMVKKETNKSVNFGIRHGVRPGLKSRYQYVFNLYGKEINKYSGNKFRLTPFSLLYLYFFHEAATKKAKIKYQKSYKNRCNLRNSILMITYENEFMLHELNKISPLIICINECDTDLLDLIYC